MLRLFLDSLDLSGPGDDGWTVIAQLSKLQNNENTSLASTSIIGFLQQFSMENMITFGPRTIWHGLQHASRSFLQLAPGQMVLQKLEDLGANRKFWTVKRSHACSLARWIALRVTGQQCLPILIVASQIPHIKGFDWIGDGAEPNRPLVEKQLPFLFSKWTECLKDGFDRSVELIALELEATFEQALWTQNCLHDPSCRASNSDHRKHSDELKRYATCGDGYTYLGAGLVETRWIAFAECTKSEHRSDWTCSDYSTTYVTSSRTKVVKPSSEKQDQRRQPDNIADVSQPAHGSTETDQQDQRGTVESHSVYLKILSLGQAKGAVDGDNQTHESRFDCSSDGDVNDAECFYDLEDCFEKDESSIIEALNCDNSGTFKAVAHHLHCAQGRTWIGSYKPEN